MANITLHRELSDYDKSISSYRMRITITEADGINPKVFVNQRLRDTTKQTFEDVFVAVATPVQLEDFGEDAPLEGSSYFRTSIIDVMSRNADYLEEVADDIIWNIQKLISDVDSLQSFVTSGIFTINASSVDIE